MIDGAHIVYDGINSWCDKTIGKEELAFFGTDHAVQSLKEGNPAKPCPDCAREIIKQLLKAIE